MTLTARQVAKKHYKSLNPRVGVYNFLRLSIFPIDWLGHLFNDKKGRVLCLGCGYGILETVLAVANPQLTFIASDIIPERIAAAKEMVRDTPNISFEVLDVTNVTPKDSFDHILFIDLMHHLAPGEQEKLLDKLWSILKPGGTLTMKDVDTSPRWKYYWNYTHDTLMAGPPLTYHPSAFYLGYFKKKGGKATYHRPTSFRSPYNHYAITVTK